MQFKKNKLRIMDFKLNLKIVLKQKIKIREFVTKYICNDYFCI
jgi:hypothetical protein